jgi:hypothetical protein
MQRGRRLAVTLWSRMHRKAAEHLATSNETFVAVLTLRLGRLDQFATRPTADAPLLFTAAFYFRAPLHQSTLIRGIFP